MGASPVRSRVIVEELRDALVELQARPRVDVTFAEPSEPMADAKELAYLNGRHALDPLPPTPARGALGSLRRAVRRGASRWVAWVIERYYLRDERTFLENLVRVQNRFAERADRSDRHMRQLASAFERLVAQAESVKERGEILHRLLEERIELLDAALKKQR